MQQTSVNLLVPLIQFSDDEHIRVLIGRRLAVSTVKYPIA